MSFKKSFEEAKSAHKPMTRTGFNRRAPEGANSRPVAERGSKGTGNGLKRSQKPLGAKHKRYQILRGDTIWSQAVRARDNHKCRKCRKRDEHGNHAHHVAPRSQRPDLKKTISNGITVCPPCHRWIHDNPIEAIAAGLLSDRSRELAEKEGTLGVV